MLKNVIFDIGGVICEYNPDDIMRRFFAPADIPQVKPIIYRQWETLDTGAADYDAYWRDTRALLPERLWDDCDTFFRQWYRTLPPIEDIWALIARLKARGYGAYILSNAPTVYAEHFHEVYPIARLVDGIVISAPIRLVKPSAEIFRYICDQYALRPEECLFVDDIAANVEGARAAGMQGFHFIGDADALEEAIRNA